MAYINLGQIMWPVGSVYSSFSSTSPASLLGGTWTAITGRFLYGNNSVATGGNNSISHSHDLSTGYANIDFLIVNNWLNIGYDNTGLKTFNPQNKHAILGNQYNKSLETKWHAISLSGSSKSVSINNMPVYQSVYMWRRTA